MAEVLQSLNRVIVKGELSQLHVLKTLDLADLVLVKSKDGHLG